MSKQGGSFIQGCEGLEDKGVRGGGGLGVARQGEIKGINDHGVREDGSVHIIISGVQVILAREGISRSHQPSRSNLPDDVKVLKEKRPVSLTTREFARIFQVGKVLVVSEDRDWMRSALQILFSLCKGEDVSLEFTIIDVIIAFCCRECLREVYTGV